MSNPTGGVDRTTLGRSGIVIIGSLMAILDATVVNVALNTISIELGAPLPTVQWIVSAYTLALAAVIPLSGWLSDRFGARRVWLAAVVLFTLGSVLCSVSPSIEVLIAARVVQGVGGGLLTPVGTVILARAAGPGRVGQVMSIMGVPLLLGPVLGPVVGGALLRSLTWEWIFLINVPIGLLALALGGWRLPTSPTAPTGPLDVVGLLLLSPGLAALLYGISQVQTAADMTSGPVLGSVVLAIALVGLFVWRSLRTAYPLVDLRLFGRRTFSAAAATTFVLGIASFGSMLLVPLYFQQVRGADVLTTGLLTVPQAVGMAAAMSVSGRLADRIGAGWVVPGGLLLVVAGFVGLSMLTVTTSFWTTSAILVVLGFGLGFCTMPAQSAAYATLTSDEVSRATPELQVAQRIGSTVGSALFAVVLAQYVAGIDPSARDLLAQAYASTFRWAIVIGAIALLPALLLPRIVLPHFCRRLRTGDGHHPLAGNATASDLTKHPAAV